MILARCERILLFFTILLLPTQLGRHFWPGFSYIYSLKIDYLSPTVFFWDILIVGLLLIWVLQKPKINSTAFNLLLFFLLTQVLSLLGLANAGVGLVRLEQYMIAGFFGVYIASQDFSKLAKKIYLPLSLGIIGESIIAILQFIKGSTLGLWVLGERTFSISTPGIAKFDFYGLEFLRPYATFPHPNVLAGFILIASCVMFQVSKERLWFTKLAQVLAGITVLLTMSRTVILAGVIILALLLRRKWVIFKSISWRLLLIMVIFLISFPVLFTRFFSILNFDSLTLLRREELLVSAWELFLKFPILGSGLNSFIPAVAGDLLTGPSRFLQPVHNVLLLTLSETGLVGLLGLIFLIGYPVKKLITYHLLLITVAPWLLIFFLGMFDHYFLTLPQGCRLLFLVWGLSLSVSGEQSDSFT